MAKPPRFDDCVGENFNQKAAFHIGRHSVMTELRRQLKDMGVIE